MQPVIHRTRTSAKARGEREWRVDEKTLTTHIGAGREKRFRWSEFVSVRLYHEPERGRPFRYVFELKPHNRRTILIDNVHAREDGGFENRSDSYTPFVRAVLARIALENPKARVLLGETQKRYFFLLLAALAAFCALAFALIVIPTPFDAWPYASPAKLVLILLMVPVFGRWVLGSLPRGVPLDAVPERALPPVSPEPAPVGLPEAAEPAKHHASGPSETGPL